VTSKLLKLDVGGLYAPANSAAIRKGETRAAIVRKRLGLEASLYRILQILSLTLFEKTPILCALHAIDPDANFAENVNQLILFDF
jgi:hypothetical protein